MKAKQLFCPPEHALAEQIIETSNQERQKAKDDHQIESTTKPDYLA